jgi:type VI secretion system secreted protein VgrG
MVVFKFFEIELVDGSVAEGNLEDQGLARVEAIEPGNCRITFPQLDQEAWERA